VTRLAASGVFGAYAPENLNNAVYLRRQKPMGVVGIQLRRYLLRLSGCERNPGGWDRYFNPPPQPEPPLSFTTINL
jgi:hypothetical protein